MNSVLAVERKMRNIKLTDEQVFCSPSYASYLRTLLRYPSETIHRRPPTITIKNAPEEQFPAFIVGSKMQINFGNRLFEKKTRAQAARLITGLAVHEFGHYRFTDSAGFETALISLFERKKWFPRLPAELEDDLEYNRADFENFLEEQAARVPLVQQSWHRLMNILEDAYIEESLYRVMSGVLLDGLNYWRYYQRKSIPTLADMLDHLAPTGYDMFSCVSDLLLSYAKFGVLKYDWKEEGERTSQPIQWIKRIKPYVDPVLTEASTNKRLTAINLTFLTLWPIIKDHAMSVPEPKEGEAGMSDTTSMMSDASTAAPSSGGTRSKPTPVSEDEDTGASGSRKRRSETEKHLDGDKRPKKAPKSKKKAKDSDASAEDEDSKKDDLSGSSASGKDEEDDSPSEDKSASMDGEAGEEKSDAGFDEGEDKSEDSSEESPTSSDFSTKGELPRDDSPHGLDDSEGEVSIPDDEGYLTEEEAEESFDYGELMASLRSLEKEMKHEIAVDEVSDELISELDREAKDMDYGAAHRGLGVKTYRVKQVSSKAISTFEDVYGSIKPTVDEMVRRVAPLLKKKQGDDNLPMSGFYTGSKFDATRLVLNDWRYFRTNSTPLPDQRTAVSVLVDESGSMSGERIDMARIAAMALYMFCDALDIKCSVIGHTESFSNPKLELQIYSDFESPDKLDKYRLLNICARENNRDGAAALFAGEHLLKRPENTKIMFVISDGAPLANGYSGVAAQTDLANIIGELRRKGVVVFAAAIGSDKEAIHRIYGDGYLDISDLKSLPNQLLFCLRRYIKR